MVRDMTYAWIVPPVPNTLPGVKPKPKPRRGWHGLDDTPRRIIPWAEVLEMRREHAAGLSAAEIARRHGHCKQYTYNIVVGNVRAFR